MRNKAYKVGGCVVAVAIFVHSLTLAIVLAFYGVLFQYNLWSVFGKDVPWYLDLAGGLAINAFNVPIAIGCCIARACGVEVPFYTGG